MELGTGGGGWLQDKNERTNSESFAWIRADGSGGSPAFDTVWSAAYEIYNC